MLISAVPSTLIKCKVYILMMLVNGPELTWTKNEKQCMPPLNL